MSENGTLVYTLILDCRLDMGINCTTQPRSTLQAIESVTTVFLILSALCTAHVSGYRELSNSVADRQSVLTLLLT